MSSKSEEDIIISIIIRKKDPDREREKLLLRNLLLERSKCFYVHVQEASVFIIKSDEIAFHPSYLPSFFCKIRVGNPKHFMLVFFLLFFFPSKVLEFSGWSLTTLLKRHKAHARESPREREETFEEEEEEKEVK